MLAKPSAFGLVAPHPTDRFLPQMTILAALWQFEGEPATRTCEAMLRAQCPPPWSRLVAPCGALALGSAGRDAEGGPHESASGTFALIADARLDNREDFQSQLGLAPVEAERLSDARLMLLCFERWGTAIIDRFVGDFALALLDRRSERLLLARDYAGQRPLHFYQARGAIAVASMAKGLHALEWIAPAVDEARLLEMLIAVPHEGRGTFFKGVERVEPGEVLTLGRNGCASRKFWSAPTGELRLGSHENYAEALVEKLDVAVKARLRGAGATLGTHLSAGLDSSAVTSSAALQFPGRVLAFTSVPPAELPSLPQDRFGNEGALARQTAAMYPNVEHRLIETGDRLPLEGLEDELQLFERPDLNLPNLAWIARINDAAKAEGIRVMLTGTMGNTTISYGGSELLGQFLADGHLRTFLSEGRAALSSGMRARTLLAQAARQLLPRQLARALDRFRDQAHPAKAGMANPSAPEVEEIIARHEARFDPVGFGSPEARAATITRVDPGTFNKGTLLRWGIDLRDPTADRRLAEFCLQVPLPHYFRNGTPRALIRTALKHRLPEPVLNNRLRGLQSPHWFAMLGASRGEAQRLLTRIGDDELARRLLDVDKMQRLIDRWPDAPGDYGPPIYRYGLLRGLSAGTFVHIQSTTRD